MSIWAVCKQVLFICIAILISWVGVHVVAIFGLFFAAAIPILYLFFTPAIPCFWCRITGATHKGHHGLIDAGLMLVATAVAISLVYLEARILSYVGFPPTPKTVSFVIPAHNQYKLGEVFPMKIEVSGAKQPVNAVQADLGFDPGKLEVVSITTDESFAKLFVQKEFSNTLGYARLTGGLPNPGFSGEVGTFGTVYFRGKVAGLAEVTFLPTSMVLANDGRGTNVLKDFATASYLITPEKVSAAEQQMEESLVNAKTPVLGTETQAQMTFYDDAPPAAFAEDKGTVLGTTTTTVPSQDDPLSWLGSLDLSIVKFWQSVGSALLSLFSPQ